jgi:hypothetical protein
VVAAGKIGRFKKAAQGASLEARPGASASPIVAHPHLIVDGFNLAPETVPAAQ